MNAYKYKILLILVIVGIMFIPIFRPTTALSNLLHYLELRKNIIETNEELSTVDNKISALRKKIAENRGADIDAESAKDVYTKVSSIDGIESIEAKIISINQDTSAVIGDYSPDADTSNIDGIQMTIYVKDISAFMTELNKLNLTYEAINVIYTENKIVVKFNTKGGLV